jgi:hypothetical protein
MIPVLLLQTLHIDYENNLTQILKTINEWYLEKMYFMQFSTKNSNSIINMPIIYGSSQIATSTDIKLLDLIIDNTVMERTY